MIKTLQGIRYLTGTSEKSLYPVTCWCDYERESGVTEVIAALRMELNPSPKVGVYGMALYARVQTFAKGKTEDQALDYRAVADCVKDLTVRIASPIHMSGFLIQMVIDVNKLHGGSDLDKATAVGKVYRDHVKAFAKAFKLSVLSDDDLESIGRERFLSKTCKDAVEEATIEQDIADSAFDTPMKGSDFLKKLGIDLGGSDPTK